MISHLHIKGIISLTCIVCRLLPPNVLKMPAENAKQYPDAPDIVEEGELTMEELKEAFRFGSFDDLT